MENIEGGMCKMPKETESYYINEDGEFRLGDLSEETMDYLFDIYNSRRPFKDCSRSDTEFLLFIQNSIAEELSFRGR